LRSATPEQARTVRRRARRMELRSWCGWCGRNSVAVNVVLSRLQKLLFSSGVVAVYTDGVAARVEARCTPAGAACPDCARWKERVRSSCLRFPEDLPVAGRRAQLALRVRRFFCAAPACGRRTFVEQVPGLTPCHGRVTERLRYAMTRAVGLDDFALGRGHVYRTACSTPVRIGRSQGSMSARTSSALMTLCGISK